MDATMKAPKKVGEISMPEKTSANEGEVVVVISSEEASKADTSTRYSKGSSSKDSESITPKQCTTVDSFDKVSAPMSCPSPEIARSGPSPNKPPKVPITETLTGRRSLKRSVYSKPKSRFGEPLNPIDLNEFEENMRERDQQGANLPNNKAASRKTSLKGLPEGEGEDEEGKILEKVNSSKKKYYKRLTTKVLGEGVAIVCILGCLVASVTVEKLEKSMIWGLEIWKWCVLIMVIFCGMVVTNWFMNLLVFIIEKNFLLKNKVLYFVHGLKKSFKVFIWLALVLVTWVLLFSHGVDRSPNATKILNYVTWTIVSFLIGAFLWLLKTLLLKILASSFHVNTFFDRIQDSVFKQYVLQTLSRGGVGKTPTTGQLFFRTEKKGKEKKIDMEDLHQTKQEKVSAWTMKQWVDAIASPGLSTISGLSTFSNTLDRSVHNGGGEQTYVEEATAVAIHIFNNVTRTSSCKYIDKEGLKIFMAKEDVDRLFPLFEGLETEQIDKKFLTDWVVKVYQDRKELAHALNDTKTAVKQLNKLVAGVLIVVMIVVWLLLMEIATTKILVLLSSQLVVAAFMFGNTCKTMFEAIIFVFVMHPFDVGDRCVIDGVQMVVEEMNILTTVFLKFDREKLYYPNSVLATKAIGNYYRSPNMMDTVEFCIDFMTPVERIGALKDRIEKYLIENSQHWHPTHNVVVKEFENVNKLKMALLVNHTMNFQDFPEKTKRRTELVMELKKIFEELSIKYNLLPQEVSLSNVGSAAMTTATTR